MLFCDFYEGADGRWRETTILFSPSFLRGCLFLSSEDTLALAPGELGSEKLFLALAASPFPLPLGPGFV
jgi:hypothetical protein